MREGGLNVWGFRKLSSSENAMRVRFVVKCSSGSVYGLFGKVEKGSASELPRTSFHGEETGTSASNVAPQTGSRRQGCQFGFFEAKFAIFALFSTPLAFFLVLKKGQMKFGFFGGLYYLCQLGFKMILADFWALAHSS